MLSNLVSKEILNRKGFTVDLAIKQSFHQVKQEITPDTSPISRDTVLGACLFVNMKKFVWVEEIAVDRAAQGMVFIPFLTCLGSRKSLD